MRRTPGRLHLDIYRPEQRRKDRLFLKIFRNQDAIPISDLLPMLENMGLKVIAERPYELEFPGGRRAWIQELELVMQAPAAAQFDALEREADAPGQTLTALARLRERLTELTDRAAWVADEADRNHLLNRGGQLLRRLG